MARPELVSSSQLLAALAPVALTPAALAKTLRVSRATVHRKLAELVPQGLVIRVGRGPSASYRQPTAEEVVDQARVRIAPEGQVRLTMGRRAADATQAALDLYSRLGIGQLHQISELARGGVLRRGDGSAFTFAQLDSIEQLVDALSYQMLGFDRGASFGIHSPHVAAKVTRCWALQRVLRHRLAWDAGPADGPRGVWHDEPLDLRNLEAVFVHSDEPDSEGLPARYLVEVPRETMRLLTEVLRFSLRVMTGDITPVMELVRSQALRHRSGSPVAATALAEGELLAQALMHELRQLPPGEHNVALAPVQARLLQVIKALDGFAKSGEATCEFVGEPPVAVRAVVNSPCAVTLDDLPDGMLLNFHGGQYRVIGPHADGEHLSVVAESHSLKTALLLAQTSAAGRRWQGKLLT